MNAPANNPRQNLAQLQDAMVRSIVGGQPLVSDHLPMSAAESTSYRRNIELMARNALAVSYPTVASLLGADRFAEVARTMLNRYPPDTGDWGTWGTHLPRVLARSRFAEAFPFLVGAARLDWRTHLANRAADNRFCTETLALLEAVDLADLTIDLADHCSLVSSRYPLLEIRDWQGDSHGPAPAAEVTDNPRRILVLRPEYRVEALYLSEPDYRFFLSLQCGRSIGAALDTLHGQDFDFPTWIDFAIRNNLIHQFRHTVKGATP